MSTPSYTPADDAKTQVFPAGPAFAPPAQEQAGNGLTDTSNGFTAEERAARAGRPVLSGAEQVSDDRSTWPHALADGMAVGSLILSLLGFGVIGIVLGAIHASNAHKLRQRASAVAAWGIGLGIAGTLGWILLIILLVAAGIAASHSGTAGSTYGG